ncbi:nicotinate-nucleotide adenylyltransferase [Alsobacter sp. SYSU BS001988]
MRVEGPLVQPRTTGPLPSLPRHAPGMRIGLLGGSFNPAHHGHLLASETALRRMGLDRVWWIVTPGNPLKDNAGLPPLRERMAAARAIAQDPRIDVTGFEAAIGTRFTHDTLAYLGRRCPGVNFVWLMGADNLANFHRWQRWRLIAELMPIAVIDRPGSTLKASRSAAAVALARHRLDESDAGLLPGAATPAWTFLHGRRSSLSSTALRRQRAQANPAAPSWAEKD